MSEPYTPAMAYPNGIWNGGTAIPTDTQGTHPTLPKSDEMPRCYYTDWVEATAPHAQLMAHGGPEGSSRVNVIAQLRILGLIPLPEGQRHRYAQSRSSAGNGRSRHD